MGNGKYALVDADDINRISEYSWFVNVIRGNEYAADGRGHLMHRIIMNAPVGKQVDHINHNGLDNRKENLRLATPAQNQANQKLSKANTSGFKGVSFDKKKKKWAAYIGKQSRNLGRFLDIRDAARAYNDAAKLAYGEFAKLNPL